MTLIGLVVGGAFLLAVLGALFLSVKRPFLGLAVLVAGMAVHNVALMAMLRLGTPGLLVSAVQVWKELDIVVLGVVAVWRWYQAGRPRIGLSWIDWLAVAFAVVLAVYLLLPNGVTGSSSGLTGRLLAFRVDATLVTLYALGRVHAPANLFEQRGALWIVTGAAAVVGFAGFIELWFLPTSVWIDWGVINYTNHLGFAYHGPGGLPENFFLTFPNGLLLRRMVSTYISPLGIAYTALLVLPLATVLVATQRGRALGWAWVFAAGLLVGLALSVTRLALLAAAFEVVLLALLLRRRAAVAMVVAVAAALVVGLVLYPPVGPLIRPPTLKSARAPVGYEAISEVARSVGIRMNLGAKAENVPPPTKGGGGEAILSAQDASITEHLRQLAIDAKIVAARPLGNGLGSAVGRFNNGGTLGESALLAIYGELGLLGGLLFTALYGGVLYAAGRTLISRSRVEEPIALALPLVCLVGGLALLPIVLTSDVWGDLSVVFLFWWAAGRSSTLFRAGE
jgi:hypothetical protein